MIENNQSTRNCLIHCRVSDAQQIKQGNSLEDQEIIGRRIAETMGLNILKIFKEQYTGTKKKRPVMDEIFDYIKKNPKKVSVLIFRTIDRFTRNGSHGYESLKQDLASLGVELIDGLGIIQPSKNTLEHLGVEYSWSRIFPSETAEVIMAQQSKNELSQIQTRMIGAEIVLVREGYHIGIPRDGYINDRVLVGGKKKPIQSPDPKRVHFFIKMFELRATGSYNDKEIVDQINAMGYRSLKRNKWSKGKDKIIGSTGGLKLHVKHFQNIISNPIYCGVNSGVWLKQPIKTKYKGLVSISTFNKANKGKVFIEEHKDDAITIHYDYNSHNKKRMKDNPLFPFKSVVLCPICCKPFLGSVSKGKSGKGFPAYHCSRNHKQYGINKKNFEKEFALFVKTIKSKESFMIDFEKALFKEFKGRQAEINDHSIKTDNNISNLEIEKLQKIEVFSSTKNEIIRIELEKQIEEIQKQIFEAQNKRNKIEVTENDIHSFIRYAKKLMEHPEEMLLNQSYYANLRELCGLIFEEIPTYTELINRTPKLSLVYRLSREFEQGTSFIAGNDVLGWNTLEMTIIKWNSVFQDYNILN